MTSVQMAAANAFCLRGVCKEYGEHRVVCDVDLSVARGESLAIIGHNGAGKTTLMKLILGLTRPGSGSIDLWQESAKSGQGIGFLPETVSFPATMTGRQMLRFYARLKNEPDRQCDQLLELVGLSEAADQKIGAYSKGMRQRLGLAQALLGAPALLLLDEPTTGLDPFLRSHFYDIIGERQLAGSSVLISSHALTEIEAQTDRIAIMKNGRILIQGSLAALRREADLPVHIMVIHRPEATDQLLQAVGPHIAVEKLGANQLQFACPEQSKLATIHQLTSHGDAIVDIAVNPPRLDDLYTYFVNGDTQ